MNFREWSNPNNWDDDGNPKPENWRIYKPHEDLDPSDMASKREYLEHMWLDEAPLIKDWFAHPRPVYTDEETIDLMIDHLERQIPVEFNESDKQFLKSVGVSHV